VKLSIVTTLYRSAPHLAEFHRRTVAAAERLAVPFELILVNDGSPDDSLERAVRLHRSDRRVRVIDLSRNFGHHRAIMAGLAAARGERVFLIDSDLEEDPELLLRFWAELAAGGADVVYGVQDRRKGGWFERASGAAFYRLFNALSSHPVPRNLVTARLMTARYVAALLQHRESELFLGGLWAITGFDQRPLPVQKRARSASTYSLARRVDLLVNAVTSFSARPLHLVFYLGLAMLASCSLATVALVAMRLFVGPFELGWPSLIISLWMIGGIVTFSVGVVGIYLSKVYLETKRRPGVIVRDVYAHDDGSEGHEPRSDRGADRAVLHAEAADVRS